LILTVNSNVTFIPILFSLSDYSSEKAFFLVKIERSARRYSHIFLIRIFQVVAKNQTFSDLPISNNPPRRSMKELCRQRAGSELRQSKPIQIIFFANPSATVDQLLLHVSGKSNRAAESNGSEPQKISDKLSEWHPRGLPHDRVGFQFHLMSFRCPLLRHTPTLQRVSADRLLARSVLRWCSWRDQAVALKTPRLGSVSVTGICHQLPKFQL
jgi:hypothetical protein